MSAGLTRVHIAGVSGSSIRSALMTRPDVFIIEDRTNARGARAFNVRLVPGAVDPGMVDTVEKHVPIGYYHRAVNPFHGGRI